MDNVELIDLIRKYALKNAHDFTKANSKAIVGKVIALCPECKKDMKSTLSKINKVVDVVNSLSKNEIESELDKYIFSEKKKLDSTNSLFLPNAEDGKVITRFPPEPSGYLHIGHAKAIYLNRTLADKYNGKMLLRFDDTNPEKEKQEYVNEVKMTLKWLGVKSDSISYSSDKIPTIYDYANKLIEEGNAYVCLCPREKIKENKSNRKACVCRSRQSNENKTLWKKMLNGEFKRGSAIVRYKGNLNSQNSAMLDPTLFRIISSIHYRQGNKYLVWPSYDFAVAILDSIEGVTHTLRTKEYELRRELFYSILSSLKLRAPEVVEYARLNIKGAPVSKRTILSLVNENKVMGWDDPRLPTIRGLIRRGILPQAVKKFVLSFGLTKSESEPDWEILLKENRKLLNDNSNHYFFVTEPIELVFENSIEKRVISLPVNPKKKESGNRNIKVSNKIYISKKDYDLLSEGEIFKLKEFCFVKINKKENSILELSNDNIKSKNFKCPIFQWVSDEEKISCKVLIPGPLFIGEKYNPDSLKISNGFCEGGCNSLEDNEVVQFERFGFVRYDGNEKDKLTFIFSC